MKTIYNSYYELNPLSQIKSIDTHYLYNAKNIKQILEEMIKPEDGNLFKPIQDIQFENINIQMFQQSERSHNLEMFDD